MALSIKRISCYTYDSIKIIKPISAFFLCEIAILRTHCVPTFVIVHTHCVPTFVIVRTHCVPIFVMTPHHRATPNLVREA